MCRRVSAGRLVAYKGPLACVAAHMYDKFTISHRSIRTAWFLAVKRPFLRVGVSNRFVHFQFTLESGYESAFRILAFKRPLTRVAATYMLVETRNLRSRISATKHVACKGSLSGVTAHMCVKVVFPCCHVFASRLLAFKETLAIVATHVLDKVSFTLRRVATSWFFACTQSLVAAAALALGATIIS